MKAFATISLGFCEEGRWLFIGRCPGIIQPVSQSGDCTNGGPGVWCLDCPGAHWSRLSERCRNECLRV